MAISFMHKPQHWRERAQEAQAIADQMVDMPSKEAMLRIARDYERLAERAEERLSARQVPERGKVFSA